MRSDAEGKRVEILKGVDATEKDVGSVADHRESREGIAAAASAAASHPMNSDSKQTSRNDDSTKKHFQEIIDLQTTVERVRAATEGQRLGRPFD